MLLSVIIPIYNAEKYIQTCLERLLGRTGQSIEVILIDDGSSDQSLSICQKYAETDARVMVKSQENQGPIIARKNGVRLASGKYIMFVDADDFVSSHAVDTICQCLLQESNLDILHYNYKIVDDEENILWEEWPVFPPGIYYKEDLEEEVYPRMMYLESFYRFGILPALWNKVVKRSLIEEYIDKVPKSVFWGEDGLITYPCFFKAEKVWFIEDFLYSYRQTDGSICRSLNLNKDKLKQNNDLITAYESIDVFQSSKYTSQLANYVWNITWMALQESLLKKILYPQAQISLKSIKAEMQFNSKYYAKRQKWVHVPVKVRIRLFCVSHKLMLPLYFYVKYQYRGSLHG